MKDEKIKRMAAAAVLAALVCAATMVIRIPIPGSGGYVHPGDGLVILAGSIAGPGYGFLAAGIGSALADLMGGYAVYVPASFLIKGLASLAAALVFIRGGQKTPAFLAGGGLAAAIVVLGYFGFEAALYGAPAAAVSIIPNLVQGLFGVVLAAVLRAAGILRLRARL